MDKEKRRDDASDHAPRPDRPDTDRKPGSERQDAPNYDETTDGGRAIEPGSISSANDE